MSQVTHMNESCLRVGWGLAFWGWTVALLVQLVQVVRYLCKPRTLCWGGYLAGKVGLFGEKYRALWQLEVQEGAGRVIWLIYLCNVTYSYVWHDVFICVLDIPFICSTIIMHMTHSYVWYDSFICVIWLIHMCDLTYSYAWHDSFICASRHMHYMWQ